jgi:hypothetical protein
MNDKDKAALEQCMEIQMRDKSRAGQLQWMLDGMPDPTGPNGPHGGWFCKPQSWEDVARFASSICQHQSLNLKPWESTPGNPCVDPMGGKGSIKLREKMDAAGISPYHPDPLAALKPNPIL